MNKDDLHDALAAWHGKSLGEPRRLELLQRISEDPELARALAEDVELEALVALMQTNRDGDELEAAVMEQIAASQPAQTTIRSKRGIHPATWLALAATLLIGFFLGWAALRTASPEPGLARILWVEGKGTTNDKPTLKTDAEVYLDDRLALAEGTVEIAFRESGVHLYGTAPLDLTVMDSRRVYLHQGEVKLHVPPQGQGFVVETLEREIIDLGTRFVVSADKGTSDVLVLDGEVKVADRTGRDEQLLTDGDRARFDQNGESFHRAMQPSPVPELAVPASPRGPGTLPGQLIYPQIDSGKSDPLGEAILPFVRAGFHGGALGEPGDGHIAEDILQFHGVAGKYNHYPRAVGATEPNPPFGWLAWYSGDVLAPKPGRYRFWGYADNQLLVAIDGKPVFEGSRYESAFREQLAIPRRNHPSFPCLNAKVGFASGEWFETTGKPVRIDLLFGEMRGYQTSGILLVEFEGATYDETYWGQPKWPLFLTQVPSSERAADLESLRKQMEDKLLGSFSVSEKATWTVTSQP